MSLLDVCRKRILDEIIVPVRAMSSSNNDGYLIMIVDKFTLKIISSCCTFYDIIEAGVTIVEQIHMKRQPLKRMDCIYFLTGNDENYKKVIEDFNGDEMYKTAHLFITSFKNEKHHSFDIFSDSINLLKKLKTLKEVNLDFIPYDSRSFYIDFEGIFTSCLDLSNDILQKILFGINTFCKTLGIRNRPIIRYQNNGKKEVNVVCKDLAEKLNEIYFSLNDNDEDCTILILDRSFDTAPLYIHDYYYQALSYDLLNIPVSLDNSDFCDLGTKVNDNKIGKLDDVYEYEISNTNGIKEKKKVVLDEKDTKWVTYRHEHIGIVNQSITEETLKFTHTNITAKIHRNDNKNMDISTSDTIQAIRALPKYQQTLARYWTHISLISECFNILKNNNIINIGEIEQCIATMIDSEGKNINTNKLRNNILSILRNSTNKFDNISDSKNTQVDNIIINNNIDRLRIVLLYISQFYGINNDDLNQLIEYGKLSNDEQIILKKLLGLGLCNSFEDIASGNGKHIHRYENYNKERVKYFKHRLRSIEIELSRFEPLIKTISYYLMCQFNVTNTSLISYNSFNSESFEIDYPSLGQIYNKNSINMVGHFNSNNSQSFSLPKYTSKNKKIIIFVIGSITFPEIRCIYELYNESNINIYIGGINITTPVQLIKQVLNS